ncbi:MAG: DUF1517 domain-containing protein [Cyanobacteria bacterium RU_5_0]|nr:DUF1517 domain-containing protein [Cyanobacteria bacterium RU_5_0]
MRGFSTFRLFGATALAFMLFNSLGVDLQAGLSGQQIIPGNDHVEARSRGGRSRGGNFNRRRSSQDSEDSGGRDRPTSRPSTSDSPQVAPSTRPSTPSYNPNPPVVAPVPVPVPVSPTVITTSPSSGFPFGLLLLVGGIGVLLVAYLIVMNMRRSGSGHNSYSSDSYSNSYSNGYGGYPSEVDNDTVTVTMLQVALLAQARQIQIDLTELTLNADTETSEGLTQLLQETVLALLRSPENWTHVRSSSKTVKSRQEASRLFEQLSIEERSKFSAEALANVGGRIRRQAAPVLSEDDGPAAYIVVTLLVGTADDRPLLTNPIFSTTDLQATLQRLGAVTPDYLMVFELLWSPQDESDSLTYDELLTEYPGLVQV